MALIALNSAWYQSNPALYLLAGALRKSPHQASIHAFTVNDPLTDVLYGIYALKPDVACFSAYIWNRVYLSALIPDLLKLLPGFRIVIGGPEAPMLTELCQMGCAIVDGPGEGVIERIVDDFDAYAGKLIQGSAPHLKDLPFSYQPEHQTELEGRLVYYEASRGCPFHCAYCLSANDKRNEQRFVDDADKLRLYDELDRLCALQPRTVKFVDRTFNAAPWMARAVWQYLKERQPEYEFHFEIHPGLLKEEDIELLEGPHGQNIRFEVGIQTTDDAINAACGRHSDWAHDKQMLITLRKRTSITIHADLLFGLPGQDFGSVVSSVDELASTNPDEIQLGLLKILPDTPMRNISSDQGYLWSFDPPYPVLATDSMDFDAIHRCMGLARIVNLYWNKGEFRKEWEAIITHRPASEVFLKLMDYHQAHNMPLHSIPKGKREEVFRAVTGAEPTG